MKKILLSIVTFVVIGVSTNVKAQCDLAFNNLTIQIVGAPVQTAGPKCTITFNASFDINTNSGFKYLFFHSWLAADYPNPSIFNCGGSSPAVNPGTALELGTAVDQVGKSFLDFGFVGLKDFLAVNSAATPTDITSLVAQTYLHDNTVVLTKQSNAPGLLAKVTKTGMILHFDISNIKVTINQSCASAVAVKTDIWGSNSNAGDPKAQCYICANQSFFNDPSITGFRTCATPRTYNLGIQTVDPTPKNITYKIYLDMNGDGAYDIGDVLAFTSGTISISSGSPFVGANLTLPAPYSNTQPFSEKSYLAVVSGPTLSNTVIGLLPAAGCIPLPVGLSSFSASRNLDAVMVRWTTAFEQNNNGFAIERNTTGAWEQIGWVASAALNGNSSDNLSYSFVDRTNNFKGISQYRLRQIDIDTKATLSEIRTVRGDGQVGKITIYPNPSGDGKINILFDDANVTRNISISDMSGRMIKEIRSISNNNITITNLQPGMYTVKIAVAETGEQVVQKIVVNKR